MRYAVIADIHGNLPALEAVLADAAANGAERYLVLGDHCISHPFPDECLSRLFSLPAYIIRGNEEDYLENLLDQDPSGWTDGQMQVTYWVYRSLQRENLRKVLALPQEMQLTDSGVNIRLAHRSDTFIGDGEMRLLSPLDVAHRYPKEGIAPERLMQDARAVFAGDSAFLDAVSRLEEGIYLFGHSHVQWLFASPDGKKLLLNPGSCGLPLDCIPDSAPYALLDVHPDGTWQARCMRAPFDKRRAAGTIRRSGQYAAARVWSEVIMRETLYTREHIAFFLKHAFDYADRIGDPRRPLAVDTWEAAFESWVRTLSEN